MDLTKAIEAHVQWKTKFRAAIQKKETMDAVTIGKDNCCELGKWLHSEAKQKLSALPSYKEVIAKHASFHMTAGEIAKTINAQKFAAAEKMIANGSDFAVHSAAVGVALTRLKLDAKL